MTDLRTGFPDAKAVLDESYFMKGLCWIFLHSTGDRRILGPTTKT